MYKYLLLDYGGVVADHYCEPATSMLGELLGVSREETQRLISEKSDQGRAYRLNQIGLETFWDTIREQVPNKSFDARQAQDLWASSYLLNEAMLGTLQYLRQSYGIHTAVLMNEDADRFEYVQGLRDWTQYVDFFSSSHQTGFLKPEKGAYETAAQRWGVSPSEILYIDDRDTHVEAAKEIGMAGYVFQNHGEFWKTLLKPISIVPCRTSDPNLDPLEAAFRVERDASARSAGQP